MKLFNRLYVSIHASCSLELSPASRARRINDEPLVHFNRTVLKNYEELCTPIERVASVCQGPVVTHAFTLIYGGISALRSGRARVCVGKVSENGLMK